MPRKHLTEICLQVFIELRARNISPNDSPYYVYNTKKKSERCVLMCAQICCCDVIPFCKFRF